MTDTAQEQDEYTEIPSREDFQRWTEEYLHFSGKGISDYYPDMGSYLHDQLVRWRHGRRLRPRQPEEGEDEPCVIWSGEHRAYWGPNRSGYVQSVLAAGVYNRAEADSIAAGCGPTKKVEVRPLREAWPRQRWSEGSVAQLLGLVDATPQREDDRLVPEACPHCSGLMGHYGDCPHAPRTEMDELLSRAVELRQSGSASEEEVREWAEKLTRGILAAEDAGLFVGEDATPQREPAPVTEDDCLYYESGVLVCSECQSEVGEPHGPGCEGEVEREPPKAVHWCEPHDQLRPYLSGLCSKCSPRHASVDFYTEPPAERELDDAFSPYDYITTEAMKRGIHICAAGTKDAIRQILELAEPRADTEGRA